MLPSIESSLLLVGAEPVAHYRRRFGEMHSVPSMRCHSYPSDHNDYYLSHIAFAGDHKKERRLNLTPHQLLAEREVVYKDGKKAIVKMQSTDLVYTISVSVENAIIDKTIVVREKNTEGKDRDRRKYGLSAFQPFLDSVCLSDSRRYIYLRDSDALSVEYSMYCIMYSISPKLYGRGACLLLAIEIDMHARIALGRYLFNHLCRDIVREISSLLLADMGVIMEELRKLRKAGQGPHIFGGEALYAQYMDNLESRFMSTTTSPVPTFPLPPPGESDNEEE